MTRTVHVVCADPLAREGFRILVDSQGFVLGKTVASVADLTTHAMSDGLTIIADLAPDSQPAAVEGLVAAAAKLKPVVLSSTFSFDAMAACFRAGADGYLVRDMSVEAFVAALNMIASGQKVLPSTLADRLDHVKRQGDSILEHFDPGTLAEFEKLSQREREVLCCLMSGSSNKIIAKHLNVSEATIKVNVKAILRKLNVSNRTQAAIWARQQGGMQVAR